MAYDLVKRTVERNDFGQARHPTSGKFPETGEEGDSSARFPLPSPPLPGPTASALCGGSTSDRLIMDVPLKNLIRKFLANISKKSRQTQTGRQKVGQTDRQSDRQKHRHTDEPTDKQTDRQQLYG